ncbi:MAG TPA: transporter substrate-binding domain-containing protein [Rheinheimera sp.]|nr:transporter substrate-binding domain-containing protein [Rheinheimera sp.]
MNRVLLCILLACSGQLSAAQPTLQWCLDHFPPRHIYQPGMTEPSGPMVDMMHELARRSGFTLSFSVPTPTERCLKYLTAGKTDMVTGVVSTPERAQQLLLAPFDIARTESWFVRSDQQQAEKTAIRRVALLKSKVYRATLASELQQKGFNVLWLENTEQALAALLLNETDAVIGPEHRLGYAIATQPRYKDKLVLLNTGAAPVTYANLAMAANGPHAELFNSISNELTLMMTEGKTRFYPVAEQPEQ